MYDIVLPADDLRMKKNEKEWKETINGISITNLTDLTRIDYNLILFEFG